MSKVQTFEELDALPKGAVVSCETTKADVIREDGGWWLSVEEEGAPLRPTWYLLHEDGAGMILPLTRYH